VKIESEKNEQKSTYRVPLILTVYEKSANLLHRFALLIIAPLDAGNKGVEVAQSCRKWPCPPRCVGARGLAVAVDKAKGELG
jgi:hypothetical protein